MKKNFICGLAILFSLGLISCGNTQSSTTDAETDTLATEEPAPEVKAHFSDFQYAEEGTNVRITTEGSEDFTGTLWSDDEKSIKADVENGSIKVVDVYHDNGQLAVHTAMDEAEADFVPEFYDEEGSKIEMTAFMEKYFDLLETKSIEKELGLE